MAPIAISTSVVKQIQAEKKYNFFNYITEQDKLNRVLGIEEQMSFDVTNAFFWHNLEDEFKAIGKALHSSIEEWKNFIKENERNQNINFALKYVNYINKEYEKVLIENRDENFAYAYFKNLKNPSLNIDVFANKFSKKIWDEFERWDFSNTKSLPINIKLLNEYIVKETLENGNADFCKKHLLKAFSFVDLNDININVDNLFKLPEAVLYPLMRNDTLPNKFKEIIFEKFGIIPKNCTPKIQDKLYKRATKNYLDAEPSLRKTKIGEGAKSMLNAIVKSDSINEHIKNDLIERFLIDDDKDGPNHRVYETLLEKELSKEDFERLYGAPNLTDRWKKKISINQYNNTKIRKKYINEKIKEGCNDISAVINIEKLIYAGVRDNQLTYESYRLLAEKVCENEKSSIMTRIMAKVIASGNMPEDLLDFVSENTKNDYLKFDVAYIKYCGFKGIDPQISNTMFNLYSSYTKDIVNMSMNSRFVYFKNIEEHKNNFVELQKFASPSFKKVLQKNIKHIEDIQNKITHNISQREQAYKLFKEMVETSDFGKLAEKIDIMIEKYDDLSNKTEKEPIATKEIEEDLLK